MPRIRERPEPDVVLDAEIDVLPDPIGEDDAKHGGSVGTHVGLGNSDPFRGELVEHLAAVAIVADVAQRHRVQRQSPRCHQDIAGPAWFDKDALGPAMVVGQQGKTLDRDDQIGDEIAQDHQFVPHAPLPALPCATLP